MTSTRLIDRKELARRIRNARTDLHLTQTQLAQLVGKQGLGDSFISQIELVSCAFRKPYHITWVESVARTLEVDIPYLDEGGEPAPNGHAAYYGDPELDCMYECSQVLERLGTTEAKSRVIDYLDRRHCSDVEDEEPARLNDHGMKLLTSSVEDGE